jgi:succinate dehydrogenase/fumarate reductase flavoprotein subunit
MRWPGKCELSLFPEIEANNNQDGRPNPSQQRTKMQEKMQALAQVVKLVKLLASLARRRHLNNSTLLYHKERLALKIQE